MQYIVLNEIINHRRSSCRCPWENFWRSIKKGQTDSDLLLVWEDGHIERLSERQTITMSLMFEQRPAVDSVASASRNQGTNYYIHLIHAYSRHGQKSLPHLVSHKQVKHFHSLLLPRGKSQHLWPECNQPIWSVTDGGGTWCLSLTFTMKVSES